MLSPKNHEWMALYPQTQLLMRPSDSNDLVALALMTDVGSVVEGRSDAGVMNFMHRMLQRGTRNMDYDQLSETVDALGISIDTEGTPDSTIASFVSPAADFHTVLDLFFDVVYNPAFDPAHIEAERELIQASIKRSEDDRFGLAVENWYQQIYGDHGYGLPDHGFEDTVGGMTRDQLIYAHYQSLKVPRKWIVIVGNFDPTEVRDALRSRLEKYLPVDGVHPEPEAHVEIPAVRPASNQIIHRDSEQAYVVTGYPAIPMGDPDYPVQRMLNTVLGEGMSSRLFLELRDKQGLAYATGSSATARMLAGHIIGYIGTKPESADHALAGLVEQFQLLADEEVPEEELARCRNYTIGKFLIDHQTNYKQAFYLAMFERLGLGSRYDDNFAQTLQKVTPAQIKVLAGKIVAGPRHTTIVRPE